MEETIIIYTKYYSEAVIEILDTYDLNVQIMCFSSYDQVLHFTKITPNLLGIIFLENRPKRSTFKAYKAILTVADEITASSKQPFCVSIISNTDLPRKFLDNIPTSNLEIFFHKFIMFNTDLLRFEGLSTVISNTVGIANESILLELDREEGILRSGLSTNKMEFLKYCLQISTVSQNNLPDLGYTTERFPELNKLIHLRNNNDKDSTILDSSEGMFKIFAKQCIARREEDEKKISSIY